MGDQLEEAIRVAFPDRTVAGVEKQGTRPGNATALVTFADGGSVFLKTATDGPRRIVREAAATRFAIEHCSVGTPTVIEADPHGNPPYLATKPLSGVALADRWVDATTDARAQWLRQVGRSIAGVHEARFDHPGRIVGGDENGLELADGTWSETLAATVEERADDLFADRFAEMPGQLVETICVWESLLNDAPATLLHGDLSRSNCRLDPPGLIDWERAFVGDPALDLVDAVGHLIEQVDVDEANQAELTDALYAGYRARAGGLPEGFDRRQLLYRVFAFLVTPQTFDLWAPQVERPDDELATWVREEFDARLDQALESIG